MKTILASVATLAACVLPAAAADGIAFITDLKGNVQVSGEPRAAVLASLPQGARITLGADGSASVMYAATGREFTLKGPGEYEVRAQEVGALQGSAPRARSTEWRASDRVLAQVSQTAAASVRMRSLDRPRAAEATAAFPAEGNVSTLQPTFRWPGEGRAGDFVLLVDGHAQPVHAARVNAGSYRMPAKLKPDTQYYWRVTSGSEQVASGRFATPTAAVARTFEARRPGPKAEFSDRVLFAILLQEMGAQQEAREAWTALSRERPDLPELSALVK